VPICFGLYLAREFAQLLCDLGRLLAAPKLDHEIGLLAELQP
jgi:hypothetical protein